MRYLVTGATGFLGAHVVSQLLQKNEAVTAARRANSSLAELQLVARYYGVAAQLDRIQWIQLDFQDNFSLEDALEGIDVLIHAAAVVSFNPKDSGLLMQTNGYGTANLVNAALYKQTPRMVMVSSIAALGRTSESDKLIHEKTAWEDSKLNSWYAKSKYRAELEVWRGMEEGLNAVIVNPGVITGIGRIDKGTGKLFQQGKSTMPLVPGGASGFVDVADVARAVLLLAGSAIRNERFVLVSENLSWKDFFNTLRKSWGKTNGAVAIPSWFSRGLASVFEFLENIGLGSSFLSSQSLRSAQHSFRYDGSKITRDAGFQYRNYRETLQEAIHFLKQQDAGSSAS